jgi:hypothetical protein
VLSLVLTMVVLVVAKIAARFTPRSGSA